MELPLTVVQTGRDLGSDVLVRADEGATVGDLVRAATSLADTTSGGGAGASTDKAIYLGDQLLEADGPALDAGICAGTVINVGGPGASRSSNAGSFRQLAVVGGPSSGLAVNLLDGTLTVGRSERCDVILADDDVSRLHASITTVGQAVVLQDLDSSNGTTVNGAPITAPTPLLTGDLIGMGSCVLTVRPPLGARANCEPAGNGRIRYNRPPRQFRPPTQVQFRVPDQPEEPQPRHFSPLTALAPLVVGVVIAVATGQLVFLLFSLASPAMLGANILSDRRSGRRTFTKRLADHKKDLSTLQLQLAEATRDEEQERRAASPDPAAIAAIATGPTQHLWERRREDPDFLVGRIGLGNLPARVELIRGNKPAEISPPTVASVPVEVAVLQAGVVGLAGPRSAVLGVTRSLLLDLAVLQSPNDLSLTFLSLSTTDGWDWLKWLPHLAQNSGHDSALLVGVTAAQRQARVDELVALVESRRSEVNRGQHNAARAWSTVLVVLDDAVKLRAEPGVAYLLREGPALGVVAMAIAAEKSGLPAEARVIVDVSVTADGSVSAEVNGDGGTVRGVVPDEVSEAHATSVARALTPLFDVASSSAGAATLPGPPLDHLELLHLQPPRADAVLTRWRTLSRNGHTPAVIGVSVDGAFTVDLVRDGPHVLIAGTTGAGKSELLQTLVASLATSNRPDRLTFLLVDFKGGSAFKECARLPHTLGVITNFDGRLVERALDSLQAELRWRQARFGEAGAKDFEEYEQRGPRGAPIPRLVVVVDELKELSDVYSEAVTRLNQIARLGRSLGVHLVLATQKPALVPGLAELRANTDLRLCLRVQDESDSKDIVGVGDAATIRRADVGRGLARLSDGTIVRFQTGYLGGRHGDATAATGSGIGAARFDLLTAGDLPARFDHEVPADHDSHAVGDGAPTALRNLVDTVAEAADTLDLPPSRRPWVEPLPVFLSLADPWLAAAATTEPRFDGGRSPLAFPVGLVDLPAEQRQEPLLVDLDRHPHLLVVGPGRSGRTTFLRSLAASVSTNASAADVHFYCLEFRRSSLSDLEALPHCGGVIGIDDAERLERFFLFLETELRRRSLGAGGGHPSLLVLCDNYEAFHERFAYEDGGRMAERFAALVSDGPAGGVHFVVTTDRRGLMTRLAGAIDMRLVLQPRAPEDFAAIGLGSRGLASDLPPGRGYWSQGPAEVQVAMISGGYLGDSPADTLAVLAKKASETWVDAERRPRRILPFPASVSVAETEAARRRPRPTGPAVVTVGLGGLDVAPLDVDLDAAGSTFVVGGARGSGRSTTLLTIARSLRTNAIPVSLCVLTPRRSALRQLDGMAGVQIFSSLDTMAGDLTDAMAATTERLALIIDDAELLLESSASSRLDRVVRSAGDNDWLVVMAGTTTDLLRRFSGWVFDARQSRSGIILQPTSASDGDLFDLRLPRSVGNGPPDPPGRGLLVERGRWTTVQVADTQADS